MKFLKENGGSIITCIVELAVGVLLLIDPVKFTAGIIIVVGAGLLISGIISVIRYFRTTAAEAAGQRMLTQGLVSLLGGIFCIVNPNWFIATFPVIALLYGVAVLVVGLWKVQITVDMIRLKTKMWFLAAISALVSIICAVIIIGNPFASTLALWIFTGISLIVESVVDVIVFIASSRKPQEKK